MITHAEAHILVQEWASAELLEVRKVWYPPVSPGFEDHIAGYRSLPTRRDHRIDATGWVMSVLQINKPVFYKTLRHHYVDGRKVGGRARRAALDAFCRAHQAWQFVNDEKNPE